jgi:hypothetical protein
VFTPDVHAPLRSGVEGVSREEFEAFAAKDLARRTDAPALLYFTLLSEGNFPCVGKTSRVALAGRASRHEA